MFLFQGQEQQKHIEAKKKKNNNIKYVHSIQPSTMQTKNDISYAATTLKTFVNNCKVLHHLLVSVYLDFFLIKIVRNGYEQGFFCYCCSSMFILGMYATIGSDISLTSSQHDEVKSGRKIVISVGNNIIFLKSTMGMEKLKVRYIL